MKITRFNSLYILYGAIILILGLIIIDVMMYDKQMITDFESCVEAGYPVLESHPRQCRTSNGKNFVEGISTIQKVYCNPDERNVDACIEIYDPVCGWFNEEISCITYPCAQTYSNSCNACKEEIVSYYTKGVCPSPNG